MSTRIHTKVATTIVAAAVVGTAAPYATARPSKTTPVQIPKSLANLQEPGSTGYVPETAQVTIPSRLTGFREPGSTGYVPTATQLAIPPWLAHFREPGSTGYVPEAAVVTATPAARGIDWISALIGAGAALGLAVASAGALIILRKRRTLAHV